MCRDQGHIAIEHRLGDPKKTGDSVRLVVPVHRGLIGKSLIGREDTGIASVLGDEEADRGGLMGLHVCGHSQQRIFHGLMLA